MSTTALGRLALGLVLAGSLAACKDDKVSPMTVRGTLADSADQVMFGVRTLITNDGAMRAELFSDTAFVFDENTRYELAGVKTYFFNALGERNTTLTSKAGTYNTRQNTMQARGNVVVVARDGRRLTTPQLTFQQARNEISSDSAFTMTEPNGRRLEGIGFVSDPDMRNVQVIKGARGRAGVVEDRATVRPLSARPSATTTPAPPSGETPAPPPPSGAITPPSSATAAPVVTKPLVRPVAPKPGMLRLKARPEKQ